MELKEIIYYSKLFSVYGKLLTEKQQEYFTSYIDLDLSLTEIASINGISKNAVFDNINKSIKKLEEFEEVLMIIKKNDELANLISGYEEKTSDELKEIIKKIGELNGI